MKKILFASLFLLAGTLMAQVQLTGVVKDSIGNPLELANVIAINKTSQTLESFGITNDQGKYKLSLKENTTYTIQISYVGMQTANEEVTTGTENLTKSFNLQNDNTLDEVQLVYEMPVTV
ncbi:MAG: carboxypeptidase-like regulatory domain-containing protein, partial [Mangrovimonas sp.]|nr:carboxypeptidase-like regulatory domain-containing protein [Mangrovimonas sp.]